MDPSLCSFSWRRRFSEPSTSIELAVAREAIHDLFCDPCLTITNYDRYGPRLCCSGTLSDGDWRPGHHVQWRSDVIQFPSIVRTEPLTPLPYHLIGNDDSALGEKILDIPEADAERQAQTA